MTHNDWFQYETGGRLFGDRIGPNDEFRVYWGRVQSAALAYEPLHEIPSVAYVLELHDAFDKIAQRILLENEGEVVLFLSGGIDSELAYRLLCERLPAVHTVTMEYPDGMNHADVLAARTLLEEVSHPGHHLTVPVNVREFANSDEATETMSTYQCAQPVYVALLMEATRLLREFPNAAFMTAGEVYVQRHWSRPFTDFRKPPEQQGEWSVVFREDEDGCFYRWSQRHQRSFYNDLFMYTPELLLSYLNLPQIQDIVYGRNSHKLSLISSKYRIMKEVFEEAYSILGKTLFTPVSKVKRTGYDNHLWFNYNLYSKWRQDMAWLFQTSSLPVRPLLESMNRE